MRNRSWWSGTISALVAVVWLSNAGHCDSKGKKTYAYIEQVNEATEHCYVAQFDVASNGSFTALKPRLVSTDENDEYLTVDPSGKYLFTDGSVYSQTLGAIRQFVIGGNGTIADNAIPSVPTGHIPGPLSFAPGGKLAIAVNNGDNTVSSYSLGSTGSLSLVNSAPTGIGPVSAVIDPTDQFAFVAAIGVDTAPQATISEYTISPDGTLTLIVTFDISLIPIATVISPHGFLYVSEVQPSENGPQPGAIVEFSINEANGGLSVVNTYSTADSNPGPTIFDPAGAYAYVTNADSLTISQFAVNASTGALTENGPDIPSGNGPMHGVVDPSGKFLFLPNVPEVSRFLINAEGKLTPDGTAGFLGARVYPYAMAITLH
jgi:6-phosphogluconolactonase (cycloisomerase 2 family)